MILILYLCRIDTLTHCDMDNKYGTFRLKKETIDYLQTMKHAFEICYGKSFTNDEFVKQMAASVEDGDVAVWETFCELSEKIDELRERAKSRVKA